MTYDPASSNPLANNPLKTREDMSHALRDLFDVRCARVVGVEQQTDVHELTVRSGLTGARIDGHMNHGLARSAGLRCSSERMRSAIERGCTT